MSSSIPLIQSTFPFIHVHPHLPDPPSTPSLLPQFQLLSPIIKEPTRPLRLSLFVLLQAANNREDRSILNWPASAPQRLRNARPDAAAECKRRTWAGRRPEAARGACFGGFEALFDGGELGFEAVFTLANRLEGSRWDETYR
jgi:hypothetical protein